MSNFLRGSVLKNFAGRPDAERRERALRITPRLTNARATSKNHPSGISAVSHHSTRDAAMRKIRFASLLTGLMGSAGAVAQTNGAFLTPVSAPTLGEAGLALLMVAVGIAGGFLARRKK
ncbi:MAG: IPTL-CTERM sorting domain-containing protein [Porticoccaceae bacterium]|nr:MAG: IPTL-CTERM sorting domain-containing protein [Porticoccaceae bacterium]